MTKTKNPNNSFKSRIFLTLNAFGNDVFYAVVSIYFVNFITSQLFNTGDDHLNSILISATTFIIMLIRIIIQLIDPIIGNAIDRTQTRLGRFVPWVLAGGTISSIILLVLFTNMGGLSNTNPWLFVAIFSILYFLMMLFFSFRDIGFWSMIPALTLNAKERNATVAFARVGATAGQVIVGIIIMPLVLALSLTNKDVSGDLNGWFWFGFIVCLISLISSVMLCFSGREINHKIRENKTETKGIKAILHVLIHNDQLMWIVLAYFLYTISNKIVTSMGLYYFQYIIGNPSGYSIIQLINMVLALTATAIYPFLAKHFTRKKLFGACMIIVFVGMAIYGLADTSFALVIFGGVLIVIPHPIVFMVIFMTFTDAIEYGQLKTGHRDESLISSTRAMAANIGSALATGYVGQAAVIACMTTGATAASITFENIIAFKTMMFIIPLILLAIAAFVFLKKITLSQERHKEIIEELEYKAE